MKHNFSRNMRFCLYAIIFAAVYLSGSVVFGQNKTENQSSRNEFCTNEDNYGNKASFHELREMTLPATNLLNVDGGQNGGIRVMGENRSDVLVRACVRTWGNTNDEAKTAASSIRVETSPNVHAAGVKENPNSSVSYQIFVPRSTNLKLMTYNGGIGIDSVEGTMDFEAHNGGIKLSDVAGNVKGRTTNGGVAVMLAGNTWKGTGLDLETTNGGVKLSMPENYAAQVEAGTVNGGFKSDINGLNVEKTKDRTNWNRSVHINTAINGGGAPIRVMTTNGGVKISSGNKEM